MPTSILDYAPITEKFLAHWLQVEAKTGKPLLLKDDTSHAELAALKSRLSTVQLENIAQENTRQIAQEARDHALAKLHPLFKQARTSLKGQVARVPGAKAIPTLLPTGTDPQKYLQAARDLADLWGRVNALDPRKNVGVALPLTIPILSGEATLSVSDAQYIAAIDDYALAVQALVMARSAEELGKGVRDGLHKQVKAKLLLYPAAARGVLAEGDPLRATIPTLTGG